MIERTGWSAVSVASVALLAACTSGRPARVVTVTTTPSPTAVVTSASPSTSSASVTAGRSPARSRQNALPGSCDTLLDEPSVLAAAGVQTLAGKDAFVVGKPDPVIHRLAYLNCRYGVAGSGASATPAIEIGVSLYATSGDAAERISATVADYSAHGASAATTTVLGQQATVLTGGAGAAYDVPTLVTADAQRTVAVSITSAVASGARVTGTAAAIARLALRRTAG